LNWFIKIPLSFTLGSGGSLYVQNRGGSWKSQWKEVKRMKKEDLAKQKEEAEEMIKLFRELDYGDKREVKGILIGLNMKQNPDAVAV
jgi:hypothetical protein